MSDLIIIMNAFVVVYSLPFPIEHNFYQVLSSQLESEVWLQLHGAFQCPCYHILNG